MHLEKTRFFCDDIFFRSLKKPFVLLIIAFVFFSAFHILDSHFDLSFACSAVLKVRDFSILVAFVWLCISFASLFEKKFVKKRKKEEKPVDKTLMHALFHLFSVFILVLAVLIVFQIMHVSISGILAFGGLSGLAVGFAAKDTLSNFFGGVMIYLDRPFSIGDWIKSQEKGFEGTVEHIGWRLTQVRTADKRLLFIPNGMFSSITLENASSMTHRRINAVFNLRYCDEGKVLDILKDVKAMLLSHPDIDKDQTLLVNFVECANWSLNFMIYAFTKTTAWSEFQDVRQQIFVDVLKIIKKHNAECAFPTYTLDMPNNNE